MAEKAILEPRHLVVAGGMDANRVSDETILKNFDEMFIEIEWSAGSSPVGAISIEVCTDLGEGLRTAWNALDFGSTIPVSGDSGKHTINFESIPFGILRVKYTRTSGNGTLNVWISGKTIGGTV